MIEELLRNIIIFNKEILDGLNSIKNNIRNVEIFNLQQIQSIDQKLKQIQDNIMQINIFLKENNLNSISDYVKSCPQEKQKQILDLVNEYKILSDKINNETKLVYSLLKIELNTIDKYKELLSKNLNKKI